jgi:hypothetical protein
VQQDEYERTRVIKWVQFIKLWLVFVKTFVDMVELNRVSFFVHCQTVTDMINHYLQCQYIN